MSAASSSDGGSALLDPRIAARSLSTSNSFPLGIASGCIADDRFSASSSHKCVRVQTTTQAVNLHVVVALRMSGVWMVIRYALPLLLLCRAAGGDFSPSRSRLGLLAEPLRHIGWRAARGDAHAFWQVDLGYETTITAVVTQGGWDINEAQKPENALWVSRYNLRTSLDGVTWDESARDVIGNSDADTPVSRDVGLHTVEPVRARFVRIEPTTCGARLVKGTEDVTYPALTHGFMCALRVELYGIHDCVASRPCTHSVQGQALGLESGAIPDSAVSASSSLAPVVPPSAARLHATQRFFREGGWSPECALASSTAVVAGQQSGGCTSQYLQVDLGRELEINAVATQGASSRPTWVTQYDMSFSNDGIHWVRTGHSLTGNADSAQVVVNPLPRPVLARYVRILPVEWVNASGSGDSLGVRWELFGPEGYRPGETGCRLHQRVCQCAGDNSHSAPLSPHEAPGAHSATHQQCPCLYTHTFPASSTLVRTVSASALRGVNGLMILPAD